MGSAFDETLESHSQLVAAPVHPLPTPVRNTRLDAPPQTAKEPSATQQVTPLSVASPTASETLVDEEPLDEIFQVPDVPKDAVPDIQDTNAERPKPGVLLLSKVAIRSRLRRVMTPTAKGGTKVSAAVIADFEKGGKSRKNIEQIFQMCGFNTDRVGANRVSFRPTKKNIKMFRVNRSKGLVK